MTFPQGFQFYLSFGEVRNAFLQFRVGQQLKIQKGSALQGVAATQAVRQVVKAQSMPSKPKTVVVKRGDTAASIAKKYGTTVDKLIQLNGLKKNGMVQLGQTLKLP